MTNREKSLRISARIGSFVLPACVAVVTVIIDYRTKAAVTKALVPGQTATVIPNVLSWEYVMNFRGAYGLFGDNPWMLILLAVVVLVVFAVSFRTVIGSSKLVQIGIGLIFGGAIGNIIDRLHNGFVVDFISMPQLPSLLTFNVADSCVSVGVVLVVLSSFRTQKSSRDRDDQTDLRDARRSPSL